MAEGKSDIGPIIKGDEIDLLALLKTVWAGRKIIVFSVIVCSLVGLIIVFTSPKKFSASATLLPSVEKKSGNLGQFSALAGMAGINIGGLMGDASGIPTELYPQVVGSVPFLMELMHEKLTWEKIAEPLSVYEMIERDTLVSVGAKLKKYTIGLPFTLKNAIFAKRTSEIDGLFDSREDSIVTNYLILSNLDRAAIGKLKNAIMLTHDRKSGLVSVNVTMEEPLISAQLTSKAVELLQRHVIDYKTSQSAENLRFIEERFTEAKQNYELAQRAFFSYKDTHRNMVTERMDLEFQRLSDAFDIASAIYKNLAQQQEQAKISVKEETPVFKVLDPVVVPIYKSAPKRGMIMVVSVLLGLFVGVGGVLLLLVISNYKSSKQF